MQWIDKVNGVDDVLAEDINAVAHGVQANETAISGKQDALTFDNVPTENSPNPVKSGGVYTALSPKEDVSNKVTSISDGSTDAQYPSAKCVYDNVSIKEDAYVHASVSTSDMTFNFENDENKWLHGGETDTVTISIPDGLYGDNYKGKITFYSPSRGLPTSIVYDVDSELITWIGTDCYLFGGNSIFRPQNGKWYDVSFYFNGAVFVGEVNGYYEATGQIPPESSAGGTDSMTLTNCIDDNSMKSLTVSGNASQTGTPTPTNPIDVLGAGVEVNGNSYVNFLCSSSLPDTHKTGRISLDRPLYKVGNYADYVVIDYDTRTATRYDNTALVNLISLMDGVGMNGSVYSSGACRMSWAPASSYKWVYNKETLCTHLPTYTGTPSNTKDTLVNGASNIYVVLDCAELQPPITALPSNYRAMTDDEKTAFKNFIDGKHMQILYPISQTVTTDVTSQVNWNNLPNTYTGTVTITATDTIKPSALAAVYYTTGGN